MSITSENNRNDYVGNGSTNDYDYTFRIFSSSHLTVTVRDSFGDETTLVLNTDYTVSGVGDATGGSIVLIDASQEWLDGSGNLDTGFNLSIQRILPLTQPTDIRNQSSFFPETHEDAFDRLVMIDQQQQDEIDRSIKLPTSVDPADFDTNLPGDIQDSPDTIIAINPTGTGLYLIPISDLSGGGGGGGIDLTQDITLITAGIGLIVRTPDGLHTWRIAVDNDGNLTTTQVT